MLIVCPTCASRYSIDDDKLGPAGRTVRCASCRADFFAKPEVPSTPEPPVAAQMVAQMAAPIRTTPALSADEALAAEWLAAEQADGNMTADEPMGATATLDQDAMDALFEQELIAANAEAIAVQAELAQLDPPMAKPPAAEQTGWKRFLPAWPAKRTKAEPLPATNAAMSAPDMSIAPPSARVTIKPGNNNRARPKATRPGAGLLARLGSLARGPAAIGLAGLVCLGVLVWQRDRVVRIAPASAELFAALGLPVNLKGLVFADIRSTAVKDGDARFLVVEGGVRSVETTTVAVPLIEVRVRGEDGRTLYTWTAEPPRKSLKPGEHLHFRTRLATPPEAARDVEVRFTDKAQAAPARS